MGSLGYRPARAGLQAGFAFFIALSGRLDAGVPNEAATPIPASETQTQVSSATPASETPETVPGTASATITVTPNVVSPALAPSSTPTAELTDGPTATATSTPTPSATATSTLTPSAAATSTPTPSTAATSTQTPSATATSTPTPSATATSTTTPTLTVSPTNSIAPPPPSTPYPPLVVLINEVAWAGTVASPNDEWIELHNPGPSTIDLTGWRLIDGGDLSLMLAGSIPAYSFFLLERTDESTVANIAADQIYTGALKNSGETLELIEPSGGLIDSANAAGGSWPGGDSGSKAAMERLGGSDFPGNWVTSAAIGPAKDADGNLIRGTPRGINSAFIPSPTPGPVSSPTPSATAFPAQLVLINEIAWSGTFASSSDEWIELHNTGSIDISLAGWRLSDGGDISIALAGVLPAYGFFLLERTDQSSVSDITADQVYTGSLRDSGEMLELSGPSGEIVDTANQDGGGWPAGGSASRASMERWGGSDDPGNWGTFTGFNGNGADAAGNPIRGTPRQVNSLFFPTPTPTGIPSRVVINEVLIRPHYDWEGTGGVTTGDEFIELYNPGRLPVYLKGWFLDDASGTGSKPYDLPGVTIAGKSYAVFFRTQTKIALNDGGDSVRLLAPDGRLIDQISYLRVRAYNLSFGRLPDGSDNLHYGLWPTPRQPNLIFVETLPAAALGPFFPWICPGQSWPAGGRIVRASMERRGPKDDPAGWAAFIGPWSGGRDGEGDRISGSPARPNSVVTNVRPGELRQWPPVMINEIAWSGTRASRADEWIELHNTTTGPIDLSGWLLTDGGDLSVVLSGTVLPGAYLLMERDDDDTVSDHRADLIYRGSLSDKGETLWLLDAQGTIVDSANAVRVGSPVPALPRFARSPGLFAWLRELELVRCGQ